MESTASELRLPREGIEAELRNAGDATEGVQRGSPRALLEADACTWNANSLFHQVPAAWSSPRTLFDKLIRSHKVLFLQETHGCFQDFQTRLPQFSAQFRVFASAVPNRAAGGFAVLVHKSLIAADDITQDSLVVPGRALRVCVIGLRRVRVFWTIPNFLSGGSNYIRSKVRRGF